MELKYTFFLFAGLLVVAAFIVMLFTKNRKKDYSSGKKTAKMEQLNETKYFRRKRMQYRLFYYSLFVFCLLGVFMSFLLLARPYKTEVIDEEKYQRDIILCLDISTSVDEVNVKLIKELEESVTNLKGERFGIVIFNTSPVLLVPLTDDYEFVNQQLEMVRIGLEKRLQGVYTNIGDNDYYYDQYISAGTLVGNEERGSSLIADGLASCVYDFSEIDKDRTRVVIFSTDNDNRGECYVTLDEAATLCKDYHVTVYGLGTEFMLAEDAEEMKNAMEKTGGKFYREGDSGSFSDIVEEIQKKSQNLVKGHHQVREIEQPETPFIILLICMALVMIITKLMKL
ncbi:MAG: hypothetical protein ACI4F4_04515 [Lachnospiraceae bacterium]